MGHKKSELTALFVNHSVFSLLILPQSSSVNYLFSCLFKDTRPAIDRVKNVPSVPGRQLHSISYSQHQNCGCPEVFFPQSPWHFSCKWHQLPFWPSWNTECKTCKNLKSRQTEEKLLFVPCFLCELAYIVLCRDSTGDWLLLKKPTP